MSLPVGANTTPEWDPDSHKYVEQLQQQLTLKMITEGIERAHRNFDAYLEEHVDINWEAQRKKVYEHFGLTPRDTNRDPGSATNATPGEKGTFGRSSRRGRATNKDRSGQSTLGRSAFGQSGMQKSVIGTPAVGAGNMQVFGDDTEKTAAVPPQEDRFSREKQGRFAEKVQQLNEARLQEIFYPILQEFLDVEGFPCGDVSFYSLARPFFWFC